MMFQAWRLKLKEVEAALGHHRLQEATQLLLDRQWQLMTYQPALGLAARLTEAWVDQGERALQSRDWDKAWQAWDQALLVHADHPRLEPFKLQLLGALGQSAVDTMQRGQPEAVFEFCEPATKRGLTTPELRGLAQAARHWLSGRRLLRTGELAMAITELQAANQARPDVAAIQQELQPLAARSEQLRKELTQLHSAAAQLDWNAVQAAAANILAWAPEHGVAKQFLARAWREVSPSTSPGRPQPALFGKVASQPSQVVLGAGTLLGQEPRRPDWEALEADLAGPRYMVWVDGVGSCLLCLGKQVTLGQAVGGAGVDIPILADISRKHCVFRRQAEGYLLLPSRSVKVDGKETREPLLLPNRCHLELGGGLQLEFFRPHALSGTARLRILSRHKSQPAADSFLLMAETCILGRGPQSHLVCPDWPLDAVLLRQGDNTLGLRLPGAFQVNGAAAQDRAVLDGNSLIASQDLSFCVEPLLASQR